MVPGMHSGGTGTRRPSVLLVDDDPMVLRAQQRFLSPYCEITVAQGAWQAASLLTSHRFDVVVTDFDMPDFNGVWLLEQVKMRHPDTRRILLSGHDSGLFVHHVGSGVIQRYHLKPFRLETLLEDLLGTGGG